MLIDIQNIVLDSASRVEATNTFKCIFDGVYNVSISGGDIDYISGTYNGYDGAIGLEVYKNTILEDEITFITTNYFPLKNLQIDLVFGDELTFKLRTNLEGGVADVTINSLLVNVIENPFAFKMLEPVPIKDLMPCNVYECLGVGERFFFQLKAKGREVLDANKVLNPRIEGSTNWSFVGNVNVPGSINAITTVTSAFDSGTAFQSIALDAKKHFLVVNLVTLDDISLVPSNTTINVTLSNINGTIFEYNIPLSAFDENVGEPTGFYIPFVVDVADTYNLVFWFNPEGNVIPIETIGVDDIYIFPVTNTYPNIESLTQVGCDSFEGYYICDNDWVEEEWVECAWVGNEWLEEPNSEEGSVIYSVTTSEESGCSLVTVEAQTPEYGEFYFVLEDTEGNIWETPVMCRMEDNNGFIKFQYSGGNSVDFTQLTFLPTFYIYSGLFADSPTAESTLTFANYNQVQTPFYNNSKASYFLNTGVYDNAIHNFLSKALLSQRIWLDDKPYTHSNGAGYALTHNSKGLYTGRFTGLLSAKRR